MPAMWRTNSSGAPSRWNSDESISPRCVLDGCTTTNTDPPTSPTAEAARHDGPPAQSWKAVAEAWRSKSRRRLSATGIPWTVSSALRRLSVRRPAAGEDPQAPADEFYCALKPSLAGDGCTTTNASSSSSSSAAATYTDPSTSPTSQASSSSRHEGPPPAQSWKAVAEAWRLRSKRRLSAARIPSMSSALRRLSVRRPAAEDHQSAAADEEFCRVLKPSLRTFSLAELRRATRNFSRDNVVGRGGFARVYRGALPGGELVAVKRLSASAGGSRDRDRTEGFLAELGHVVNVSHPNVARLVGVGVDGGEHLLVFPFSRLGCLSGQLHGAGGAAAVPMKWADRHRVALGTARGIEYLHERCARRIVHRDIKPANILLMDNYEPLICDFGLARWLPAQLTHLQVTVFEGTFGYVPPEYTTHGVFSEKTDVFALGVVLLELLTGRRAVDAAKLSLVAWARQFLDAEDEVPKMADPALGGQYDAKQLRDMAWAAKLCISSSPDRRPRMSHVVQVLQGAAGHCSSSLSHPPVDGERTSTSNTPRYTDDLSRHKALAFDFESSCPNTPR